jgi:tetratricopeptide (TPR) repeat protein
MNLIQYSHIINKPTAINDKQTIGLEKMIIEFPYFQSARALYLKGLFNQSSYSYNFELKKTAAHTTDRSILFDFITSENFVAIQKGFYDDKISAINEIKVNNFEIIETVNINEFVENKLEKSILKSILASETEKIQEKLEIGKPLDFSINEKHSFQEWLQLSRIKPIERQPFSEKKTIFEENNPEKRKKLELIDKFIEASPKIPQIDKNAVITSVYQPKEDSENYLMTETLAKVYLEQKKYAKAIQAYEILILKYPEKNSIFAIRIQDIKILQNNNI